MFRNNSRNLLIAGAFALVAVVAALGWMHKSNDAPAPLASLSTGAQPGYALPQQAVPQPTYDATSPSANYYGNTVNSPDQGYYSTTRRPVYVRTPQYQAPVVQEPAYDPQPAYNERTTVVNRREVYETRPVHRGRSKGKSVAIVAGSAGAGAAIGALAGGGKGAAIGALTGGGAGFVYDRMTHNH